MLGLSPDLWRRSCITAWVIASLFCCARPLVQEHASTVYPIFARAARNWQAAADLYPMTAEPYRYSPGVAGLFTPFAVLPDAVGGCLWRVFSTLALLAAMTWFLRTCLPARWGPPLGALFFLIVLPSAVGNINNGQTNPLLCALLLGSAAAVRRCRWNVAAVLLALACAIKVYPVALALLLVGLFPRHLALRFAGALAVVAAVPFALQSPEYVARQYQQWGEQLKSDERHDVPADYAPRDLRLLCRQLGRPLTVEEFHLLQLLAGAGMLGLCLAAQRAGWPRRRLTLSALLLASCWMTVFNPAAEACTYMLLAPALGWGLIQGFRRPWPAAARWLCVASGLLLLVCTIAVWFPTGKTLHVWGLQPAAGLLLLAALVRAQISELAAPVNAPASA